MVDTCRTETAFMPLLVWLGHPFFATELPRNGWRVVRGTYEPGVVYTWDSILALTGGRVPCVVVVADVSAPPFVLGTERFPCLTAFYAVDTHIHSWYPLYAQGFDLCLVSLKDHLPDFLNGRLTRDCVWWSAPFSRDNDRPPDTPLAPEWDLLFVGTIDPTLTPERHAFLQAIKERFPGFHATTGSFSALYPRARLLLNESGHGELNFRVFEALGMGGCLLTPDTGPPLTDLFSHGKELFLYPNRDVDALLLLVRQLLDDDEALRRRVAAAGLAAIDAGHRSSTRARQFTDRIMPLLRNGLSRKMIAERLAAAPALHRDALRVLYLHHAETVGQPFLQNVYLAEARKK